MSNSTISIRAATNVSTIFKPLVDGVEFVRKMNSQLGKRFTKELIPGPGHGAQNEVVEFIKNEAWGHHASCTNRIGPSTDPMAVLDSSFRVRGTEGLRVVDASVFPKIPGHFIVSAVYMISEKALDVILEDAEQMVAPCAEPTPGVSEGAAAERERVIAI